MKNFLIILILFGQLAVSSCVGIGYSNRGGWFVWPGGLGLILIILFIVFLFRRR